MATASFPFLAFALVAAVVYNLSGALVWRQASLLVANMVFLYTFVANVQSVVPFVAFLLLGFIGVRAMQEKGGKWGVCPFSDLRDCDVCMAEEV